MQRAFRAAALFRQAIPASPAHSQTKSEQVDTNVVSVGDYAGLRRAIRDFVRGGVGYGVIRVQQYAGDSLEEDLAADTPLRARTRRALTR